MADALGAPLTAGESVDVADADPADPYDMTFSYDQLVNLTGFTMYDATTGNPVAISGLTGPLAATLIYSDPLQRVMPAATAGPLRFVIADATSENVVMYSQLSVYHVNLLNVIDPGARQVAQRAQGRRSEPIHTEGNHGCTCPTVDERTCSEADMVRRVFTLRTGVLGLALAAVVVMGLAVPASAFACPGHIIAPPPSTSSPRAATRQWPEPL